NSTPDVNFDPQKGYFELSGKSVPENSMAFYSPLIEYLEKYANAPNENTSVHIKLKYFNTNSSKYIFSIFKIFENIAKTGHGVEIYWYYNIEDEDIIDSGEEYKALVKVPFKFVEF
ncbi:MAG: DUF1987 domain-containing protein, partial [Bacteroidia bacterium]|nr:DUF1987 domain-containing protein [Bacteroidia bacterium]